MKNSKNDFRFTLNHLVRIAIFFSLFIYLINYFNHRSGKVAIKNDITLTLEEQSKKIDWKKIISFLPDRSQELINHVSTDSTLSSADILKNFPQSQIEKIKRWLVTSIASEILKKYQ